MPKKLKRFIIHSFETFGVLVIAFTVCNTLESLFNVELQMIRAWLVVLTGIVGALFAWRGYDGFYRKGDFFFDD